MPVMQKGRVPVLKVEIFPTNDVIVLILILRGVKFDSVFRS
jgi:hypothetical protein